MNRFAKRIRSVAPRRRASRGFSLVTAVFLLVVLAGLGAAMVNIAGSSQSAVALDVQGARAYQAARAGIEWGLYQQLQLESCAGTTSFSLPSGTTLSPFTVTVVCVSTPTTLAPLTQSLTGTVTSGSSSVTTTASTSSLAVGMSVVALGVFAPGTVIAAIPDATHVQLSVPALAAGSGITIKFRSALDRWMLQSTACNQPTAAGACPNSQPANSRDYVQRVMQVEF